MGASDGPLEVGPDTQTHPFIQHALHLLEPGGRRKSTPGLIAQTRVPKIGYLSSWGAEVVLKWPSGGPGSFARPQGGTLS